VYSLGQIPERDGSGNPVLPGYFIYYQNDETGDNRSIPLFACRIVIKKGEKK